MSKVIIDKEKCTGCGLCAKDCVGFDISIVENKAVANGMSCIGCGHCEAVCPNKAVALEGYEDSVEEFEEQVRLNPKQLMDAIKTRRTIRQFTEQKVSEDILEMILEAGRLAPTGTNAQGTGYIVLEEKKDECEKVAVGMFRKVLGFGRVFVPMLKTMKITDNFFFKKAPLVIVVLGKDEVSASLAAENMAFMAEANGLGVLFSGFFTMCLKMSGKIRKIIGIKGKVYPVTTLVIGYPAVKYHRTVHRKTARIIKA
ncbi:MAG: nitroreductase family protein [Treponema sp.]|nr:nitroreductase family protein [Treponema sp.]